MPGGTCTLAWKVTVWPATMSTRVLPWTVRSTDGWMPPRVAAFDPTLIWVSFVTEYRVDRAAALPFSTQLDRSRNACWTNPSYPTTREGRVPTWSAFSKYHRRKFAS